MTSWIGVDLDGTLATYDKWVAPDVIGQPIKPICDLVRKLLAEGEDVRIFTARAWPLGCTEQYLEGYEDRVEGAVIATQAIDRFCQQEFGKTLPITCCKDYGCLYIIDDRAKQVIPNTGTLLEDKHSELIKLYWELRGESGCITMGNDVTR